ncbi:MAG: polysaccharide biosynthesis/export family protein [Candidatus Omnitrophica bacterium]|nr:polysaccharide biosynthesis/export family protein [Candidatus Omnitrophota bacterium]
MKKGIFLLFILLLLSGSDILSAEKASIPNTHSVLEEYRIGPENVLQISVYYARGERLSQKVKVSSRGIITFPLLGEVKVNALTVSELEQRLKYLLGEDYLVNPQVSVFIEEYSTVSILGEVKTPGSYPIQGKLTIIKLISLAGGFTEIASPNKVKVIRTLNDNSKQEIKIRVRDIINKGKKEDNISLKAGDVVVVPESIF